MSENFLFYLTRVNSDNGEIIKSVLNHVETHDFVEKDEFNDHIMLMDIMNNSQINVDNTSLWS